AGTQVQSQLGGAADQKSPGLVLIGHYSRKQTIIDQAVLAVQRKIIYDNDVPYPGMESRNVQLESGPGAKFKAKIQVIGVFGSQVRVRDNEMDTPGRFENLAQVVHIRRPESGGQQPFYSQEPIRYKV